MSIAQQINCIGREGFDEILKVQGTVSGTNFPGLILGSLSKSMERATKSREFPLVFQSNSLLIVFDEDSHFSCQLFVIVVEASKLACSLVFGLVVLADLLLMFRDTVSDQVGHLTREMSQTLLGEVFHSFH